MNVAAHTREVKAAGLADWLLARGVHSATTPQLAKILGIAPEQVRQRLHAPLHRGQWVSPARGLWIPVPPEYRLWGAPQGIEIIDTLMSHLAVDYYVGWLSAAEIHGAAHQAPQVFQVATSNHVRQRQVGRTRMQFLMRQAVRDTPTIDHPTRSGRARVASREATAMNLAADPELSGGIDNVATVIVELAEQRPLDLEALATMVPLFATAAGRRIGWLLNTFSPYDELEVLRQAVAHRSLSLSNLDPRGPTTGTVDPTWNIRINRKVEPDL